MSKILLVEDDIDLSDRVSEWLRDDGYVVEAALDGATALAFIKTYLFDLLILDWQLPGASGVDICRQYRSNGGVAPVLMLTSKSALPDKITGLDAGADDYMSKPFHIEELSARVRALLRRPQAILSDQLHYLDLTIIPSQREVRVQDQPVHLLPKEYALLEFFVRHPNQIFSPEQLLNGVWESSAEVSIGTVYTNMKTLRKKLGASARSIIVTASGGGYMLRDKVDG
jgi:DNA-binding response OmpR family regulator